MLETLGQIWPHITAATSFLLAAGTSAHAVLRKRDSRAAVAWVGLVWLVPVVGAILYITFGINRIRRRATAVRGQHLRFPLPEAPGSAIEVVPRMVEGADPQLLPLARLADGVSEMPLLPGNTVAPLVNGEEAYPAMLESIEGAERSVSLMTYIFDNDRSGQPFRDALVAAAARGVEVRVLIDSVGARYSWPSMVGELRRAGLWTETFLPTVIPWRMPYFNLRNHRKILVVDGRIGFTGGMNIRDGHMVTRHPKHPIQDVHFRIEGPVVAEMQQTFADDWAFVTGERLLSDRWFPEPVEVGPVLARGIGDGPDERIQRTYWLLLGALACARSSVRIMTPYFVPDTGLITALNMTAMRGVRVDILLPEDNNLALVQWASTATLWQVLERGCRIWLSQPPFDHSKLFLVDGAWAMIGSANWDTRSLRLNFEFCLECYDRALIGRLERLFDARRDSGREITLEDVDGRMLPAKLRDGVARLFTPYL